MLAHPLGQARVDLADYAAEWKWDGIRVQLVHVAGETRLYSSAGDDIPASFPEVAVDFRLPGALAGDLLAKGTASGGGSGEGAGAARFTSPKTPPGSRRLSARCQT